MIEVVVRRGVNVSADALRVYVATLRRGQDVSQESLAEQIGMAKRTYIAWETGETTNIKAPQFLRALRVLGGSFMHLDMLESGTTDQGEQLAKEWLELTPAQRVQINRIHEKLERVVEVAAQDRGRVEAIMDALRVETEADPRALEIVQVYLDGRLSRHSEPK